MIDIVDVAIIGAGELGGSIAHALARADLVSTIRLVDEAGHVAAGKALDIMQSGPIDGFSTLISGSSDLFTIAGASVIIFADSARRPGPLDMAREPDADLVIFQRALNIGRDRLFVCANVGDRDLVERGVQQHGIPRHRAIGTAPEALAAAVRACVALEAHASPTDVSLTILGDPPAQIVVPWQDAAIAGRPLTRLLDEPACRRLAARVPALWPPGPHTLAAAAVKALRGICGQSRDVVSCFVAPDDSAGRRMRACALPVRLGPDGIVSAEVPELDTRDRVALENAMLL